MAAQKLVSLTLMDITRGHKPGLKWAQLRACNVHHAKLWNWIALLVPLSLFFGASGSVHLSESRSHQRYQLECSLFA